MPPDRASRVEIMGRLQAAREGRKIIAYVTSTRPNLEVMMRMDVIPLLYEHIRSLRLNKSTSKIDLFLHTNGGDGVVPWRLMSLLREYASEVCLLVPHRAYSAGTLTALGADRVVMHPMGTLGPIDPTVANPFNPPNPQNASQVLGISVEDVAAYVALVKEDVGISHEDELVQAFNILARKVHPLALGNVKRQTAQSRMLAEKLLKMGKGGLDTHSVGEITEKLGSKIYFHGHPINRGEARSDLGMTFVEDAAPQVEELMWELYSSYVQDMRLDDEWQPVQEALPKLPALPRVQQQRSNSTPTVTTVALEPVRAVRLESESRSDVRDIRYQVTLAREWNGHISSSILDVISERWVTEPD